MIIGNSLTVITENNERNESKLPISKNSEIWLSQILNR